MHRVLLVSPDKTIDAAFAERAEAHELGLRGAVAPLELATLAALTPDGFDVDIWDETVDGEITAATTFDRRYDIVGVTGFLAHVPRMLELHKEFQRRGSLTVAGGPAVSGSPERFRGVFDVLCLGESEFIWPQFLREWRDGKHMSEYRQIERPNLADSPIPRWDKVRNLTSAYACAGVQTTRGCPFDCEFCDVIHLFGRQPRHKPVEAVLEEVRQLERLGTRVVFFSDDNFIGNPHYAKKLLPRLIELNNSFRRPLGFTTQITINVAKDAELLQMLADANFVQLYIGLETPRTSSLIEVHKHQNTRGNMVDDVLKVQSYGLMVRGLMMVGFDNDDPTIFDEMYDFFQASHLTNFRLSMLQSFPGTPQTARLLKEGRVLEMDRYGEDESFGLSNVIPKQMTREELFRGYLTIQERLHDWQAFETRLLGAIRNVSYTPPHAARSGGLDGERLARLRRLFTRFPRAAHLGVSLLGSRLAGPALTALAARRGRDLRKLRGLIQALPAEGRAVLAAATREAILRAPWLVPSVILRVAMQPGNIRGVERMRAAIERRLALESQPGHTFKTLASVQIPPDFKRIYREQFAITLKWLKEGLHDHAFVAEGLVRVWKDFVIRYGATFETFADYHMVSLRELVDRTIEQGNSGELSHTRSAAKVDTLTSLELRMLSEQVIFAVEQDLKSERSDKLAHVTLGAAPAAATGGFPLQLTPVFVASPAAAESHEAAT